MSSSKMPLIVLLGTTGSVAVIALSAYKVAPVYNEFGRLASGVIHWQQQDFMTFTVNPPLPRSVAALPAVVEGARSADRRSLGLLPTGRYEYLAGIQLMQDYPSRRFLYLYHGRVTCLVFFVIGSFVCFWWAQDNGSPACGLIAATLWCTSPLIVGHSLVISPDLAAAAFAAGALYCFLQWLKRPRGREAIVAGVVLGLAELCKFTLVVLYPLLPLLWIAYRLPDRKTMAVRELFRQGGLMAGMLLLSIHVLNCGYLFAGTFEPIEKFRFQTALFNGIGSLEEVPPEGGNVFAGTWIGGLPSPLPAAMIQGLDTQRLDFERGLPSYVRGQWSDHGWWYYYLYALAVKGPLGMWCLVALAAAVTVFTRDYNSSWRDEMVIVAPGLVILTFVSSQTGFSAHSRYVIPALPFLFVWTSKLGRVFKMQAFAARRPWLTTPVVVALVWSVGSHLWVFPHSLSYFNELVGGPQNGAKHLLDSNIDWGQDLFYLTDWLDDHSEVTLDGLAYHCSYPVALTGLPETPSPPTIAEHNGRATRPTGDESGPTPGWHALSVHYLYSRERQYRYFLDFQPVATAGYSIYIYYITHEDADQIRRKLHEAGGVHGT